MKFFRNKLAVTIIVLSVTFLGIIFYSVKRDNKSIIESGAGNVLNPVQKVLYSVNNSVKNFLDFAFNFREVKEENKKLTDRNNELETKAMDYDNLKNENDRLRELLNFKNQRADYEYTPCNIIGKSGGSLLEGYTIDKGKKDGLEVGMVVVTAKGLVGQVTSVDSNYAIVQTLLNENIAVSVLIESTRETTGIVKGYKGSNNKLLAKVYYLPIDSQIKEGDVILTSGQGDMYPKDIKIGQVLSVEEDKGKIMKNAIIEPYVDFNKLEELLVVIPKDKKNIKY